MKAAILDRDGTIVWEPSGPKEGDTAVTLDKLKLLPHAVEGLRALAEKGYVLFIATNQDGINRGQFTRKEYDAMNKKLKVAFDQTDVRIVDWECCPHLPIEKCNCRKPKTGMIDNLRKKHEIDFKHSCYIGDRETDILLSRACGLKAVLVKRNEENFAKHNEKPDIYAENLVDAARQL